MDGSALHLVAALLGAGCNVQGARRAIYTASAPVRLTQDGATLTLHPGEGDLCISYLLDYGLRSPLGCQRHTQVVTPASFAQDIADCRTFILETEAAELRRQGLGARTTAADLLVFGRQGPIGNRLRHADEPARHKILDLVGDLALFGHDLRGHVVAYRSGHPLNIRLACALVRQLGQACPSQLLAA
jgi:UDP-3-O-acyl-N-acetylglucosamine deacetylase